MVAVISGSGLGLLGTSASVLGAGSQPGLNQSGASQYVNVATGNLIVTGQDEQLVAQGLLARVVRTYNSLGDAGDIGGGAWLLGLDRRVGNLTGTLGTAGSTVTRTGGDGEEELFTYDATHGLYVGTTGSGAQDTLAWDTTAQEWTYTNGTSHTQDIYDAAGTLCSVLDPATGTRFTLGYDPTTHQLISMLDGQGEGLLIGYDTQGRVQSLSTLEIPPGGGSVQEVGRVTYGYDALDRLTDVTTDLTPSDTADAQTFATHYTYDGDSLRLASLTQGDGVTVAYTYAQDAQGAWRIASVTLGTGAAAQRQDFSYDLQACTTTVTDASGRAWTYAYDAQERLISVTSPAVDGQRQVTGYSYTTDGHLASVTDALGQSTIYRYDAHGNRVLERDADGHTISATYSDTDHLLTRTVYLTADPQGTDVADAGAPADPATTRYVYDTQGRLRYVIDADGDVLAHEYDAQGRLTCDRTYPLATYDVSTLAVDAAPTLDQMDSWAGAQDLSSSTLTAYGYDAAGRLARTEVYDLVDAQGNGVADAGESITTYVYDAQGLLRQQLTLRGVDRNVASSVSYGYDGLGRLIARTDAVDGHNTSYVYDDAHGTLAVKQANGLVRTEVRDSTGALVTVTESATGELTRTTQYVYDAQGQLRAVQDAGGAVSYTFYDAAGRVAGTVDATGAVVAYTRDADGRVVASTAYATRISTANWLANGAADLSTDLSAVLPPTTADDRTTLSFYDAAGQLAASVVDRLNADPAMQGALDPEGAVVTYCYDGAGRRISSTAYATALTTTQFASLVAAPQLAALEAMLSPSGQDRTGYTYYDVAGRVVATLDAAGDVTTVAYDGAGRVVRTQAYATPLDAATLSTLGTPPALGAVLAKVTSSADDQVTRTYYDAAGRPVASVDADGYLTVTVYDETVHTVTTTRYGAKLGTALTGHETVETLIGLLSDASGQTQVQAYDADGRLTQQTAVDGTITTYTYDPVSGQLRGTTSTPPTGLGDVRSTSATINAFGEVSDSVDGAGIHATYQYNALGQRVLATDAQGNHTWYFYDAAGRLAYSVQGIASNGTANALGEVTALDYDAFGEVVTSRRLAARLDLTNLALGSSTPLATVAAAVTAILDPVHDQSTTASYTHDGQVASTQDGLGYVTQTTYDTFGEIHQRKRQLSEPGQALTGTNSTTTTYGYNALGQLTETTEDDGGLSRTTHTERDAFGRVTKVTDARGNLTTYRYDPLGRQVSRSQDVQTTTRTVQTTYDAYGRVVNQTDPMGQVTSYQYTPDTRTLSVTTPDGVKVSRTTDAYGDTLSVTDTAGNTTHYTYNGDGQLLTTTGALGKVATNHYNGLGQLDRQTDASGRVVSYTYDAAGRVLTRVVDPDGLAHTTTYTYDGRGQQVSVTDATLATTTFTYDADGNTLTQVQDTGVGTSHATSTTTWTWDGAGHQLSVTEGDGTADARTTNYVYDHLGRRTQTIVDPQGHPLKTVYTYDGNDNLVAVTDPKGFVTRYVYDQSNARVYTIDPASGVVQAFYDADGRVTATRTYATAISLTGLTPSLLDVANQVKAVSTDQRRYTVYDAAGRVHYTVDPLGYITETTYDINGRVAETIAYAQPVTAQAFTNAGMWDKLVAGTADGDMAALISAAGNSEATAQASLNLYDADGRLRFVVRQDIVDGARVGFVTERRYDDAGRVIAELAYGTPLSLGSATLATQLSTDGVSQRQVNTTAHMTRYVYDAAGQQRYVIDANRYVTEQCYDADGRVTQTLTYLKAITVPGTLTEATVAAAVSAANTAATDIRTTTTVYDHAGRVWKVTDAIGTQTYTYDATGLKHTYTDRDSNTWTYAYDGAGRLTDETSPAVTVASFTGDTTLSTQASVPLVTHYEYDDNGNVTHRTEASGTSAARTVIYGYDSRNHQTSITYPDAGYVDASGVFHATSSTGSTNVVVTYDTLGHAVVNKDVRGNYQYKIYDVRGEVTYEVQDAGNDNDGVNDETLYVTAYRYDAYGNVIGITRYATPLNASKMTGWTKGQPMSSTQLQLGLTASAADDRTISTSYDLRNQKVQVQQASVSYVVASGANAGQAATGQPTTTYTYDAYGNLTSTSVLQQGAYGTPGASNYTEAVWATTYSYYDALNHKVMDVDPMGYVTTWVYDGAGEVTTYVEYANPIDTHGLTTATKPGVPALGGGASGYDRTTLYTYDGAGRKSSQTFRGSAGYVNDAAGLDWADSVTSYTYDGENRITSVTLNGATTSTVYDALGRVTSVTEPTRKVLGANWQSILTNASVDLSSTTAAGLYIDATPVTYFAYDALGNAVRVQKTAANAATRTSYSHYDTLGREVVTIYAAGTTDPNHTTSYYSAYDAAGNKTKTWYTQTANGASTVVTTTSAYDNVGQRLNTVTKRAGITTPDAAEYVKYNAFGEIVAKGDGVVNAYSTTGYEAVYEYDNAGRAISAPDAKTGAIHSYGYDLAGHLVLDLSAATAGAGNTWTHMWLDLDGRATMTRGPSTQATSGVDGSTQTTTVYDRWGNALSVTDTRGYVTTYLYDSRNNLYRETEPTVLVVGANGAKTWQAPVTYTYYDINSRLIETKDENGHTTLNTYDIAGDLIVSQDATGAKTYTAYNGLGLVLARQTPAAQQTTTDGSTTGAFVHITWNYYSLDNQVIVQGDFTVNSDWTTRKQNTLSTYGLNNNGDRITVTDALGQVSHYDFDSQHRVLKSQTPLQTGSVAELFTYDVNGRQTRHVDANNLTQTWSYDYFGRVHSHTDLNGNTTTYTYDSDSGLLTLQSSDWTPSGQGNPAYLPGSETTGSSTITYSYFASGQLTQATDRVSGVVVGWTAYSYDDAGETTRSETWGYDGANSQVHTLTLTDYDSHGRIAVTTQSTVGGTGIMRMAYLYDAAGNRRAVYVQNGSDASSTDIDTSGTAVTATAVANKTAQPGDAFNFDASPNFDDKLGFGLTWSATLLDGSNLPGWLHRSGAVFTGTPTTAGSWSIKLTATDVEGHTATVTFTVTVPVVAPEFSGALASPTAHIGTAVSFAAPAATDANGATLTYTADWYNGSAWVALPAWLAFNTTTRTFSGTPPVGSIGSYQVRVVAHASNGAAASIGATLTVAPTPPVYQSGSINLGTLGAPHAFTYVIPANAFVETDGTQLSYEAGTFDPGILVRYPDADPYGPLPDWLHFNATTRTFSGTPPTTVIGQTFRLYVRAANPQGMYAEADFSVSVDAYQQPPPVYNGGYTNHTGVIGGSSISIAKPATAFTEPDGGALTYSGLVLIPQHSEGHFVYKVGDYVEETVAAQWVDISQVGLSINATTGTISGVPRALQYLEWNGADNSTTYHTAYQLEVVATNAQGGTAAGQFTLTNTYAALAVAQGVANPAAQNPGAGTLTIVPAGAFTDPYGQGLTYTAALSGGAAWPGGLTWSGASLTIGATPSGSYTIVVTARDGLGRTVSDSFVLTVNNVAPVWSGSVANRSALQGVAMTAFQVPVATDANGDAITYSATGLPPGVVFNASTRTFSGTPTTVGTYTVYYKATDSRGAAVQRSLQISVSKPAPPVYNGGLVSSFTFASGNNTYVVPSTAFSSPEGYALTYSSNASGWLHFSPTTRTFTATLDDNDYGPITITVTARDSLGHTASASFTAYGRHISNPKLLDSKMSAMSTSTMQMQMVPIDGGGDGGTGGTGGTGSTGGTGTTTPTTPNIESYWFTYDADNRVQINNGALVSGQIQLKQDSSSSETRYDAAGNAVSHTLIDSNGHTQTQISSYDERNELVRAAYSVDVTAGGKFRGIEEQRVYRDDGKLLATEKFYALGTTTRINGGLLKLDPFSEDTWTDGTDIGGELASATIDHYDANGRLLQEQDFANPGNWQGGGTDTPPTTMPGVDATSWAGMGLQNQVTYRKSDGTSGYDAVGNVRDYSYKDVIAGRTDTYHVDYFHKDGYLERDTTSSSSNTSFAPAKDTSYYNVFGQRLAIEQHVQLSSGTIDDEVRTFAYDANGEILRRRDGTVNTSSAFVAKGGAGTIHYAYVNGQQVGSVDEGGGIDVLNGLTAFSNTETGTSGYVVQTADTLRSIAQAEYGDASLWYVIAQANALDSDDDLVAGQTLNVPQVKTNSNDAATFKPYNPAEISGSTTPPSVYVPPPPPSPHHCSTLAMIIVIAVVVVATIMTAGAAAAAMGVTSTAAGATGAAAVGGAAMTGGALAAGAAGSVAAAIGTTATGILAAAAGGFVGSIAGQLVGDALGVSNGLSWKQAVGAGLGAGITAGLSGAVSGGSTIAKLKDAGNYAAIAEMGAAGSVGGYLGSKLVHQPAHFSWANVAAAGLSTEATAYMNVPTTLETKWGQTTAGNYAAKLGGGLFNGAFESETARLFGGDARNGRQIVEDAFGNMLANAAIEHTNDYQHRQQNSSIARGVTFDPRSNMPLARYLVQPDAGDYDGANLHVTNLATVTVTAGDDESDWESRYSDYLSLYGFAPMPTGATPQQYRENYSVVSSQVDARRALYNKANGNPQAMAYLARQAETNQGEQWLGSKIGKLEAGLDDMRAGLVGAGASSSWLPSALANDAANKIGLMEGGMVGAYKMASGLASMAQGAEALLSPEGWAYDREGNVQRLEVVGETLGRLDALGFAAQTGDLSTIKTLGGPMLDGLTQDYQTYWAQGDYSKLIGRLAFDVGSLFFGGEASKMGLFGDVAKVGDVGDTRILGGVPDNVVTRTVGRNTVTYTLDAQGNPISAKGSLLEDFGGGSRSYTEVSAQGDAAARGVAGDQGGHLVAYRFMPEQGPVNLFPQDANFNTSAFKTLENDYARYVNDGHQVDFEHTLGSFDPLTGRPGTVDVGFTVRDASGNVVDSFNRLFNNAPRQAYLRRVY